MPRTHRRQHARKHHVFIVAKKAKPKLVDRLTFIVAIVEPLTAAPQAVTIFAHRTAAGISLSTWVGFSCLDVIWVWYGIEHKTRAIIIESTLFLAIQLVIIAGGLLYGAKW